MGEKSLPLAAAAIRWAREAEGHQPLTIGAWTTSKAACPRRLMEMSDVVSFHGYDTPEGISKKSWTCRQYNRPVLCTEWLFRQSGNTFETILPIFAHGQIGGYHWGLVAGRMHRPTCPGDRRRATRCPSELATRRDARRRQAIRCQGIRVATQVPRGFPPAADQPALVGGPEGPGSGTSRSAPMPAATFCRAPRSIRPRCGRLIRSIRNTIDRELAWAKEAGYNSIRVFLQYIVWKDDPEGLKHGWTSFWPLPTSMGSP